MCYNYDGGKTNVKLNIMLVKHIEISRHQHRQHVLVIIIVLFKNDFLGNNQRRDGLGVRV
jgi:hypothetical protein